MSRLRVDNGDDDDDDDDDALDMDEFEANELTVEIQDVVSTFNQSLIVFVSYYCWFFIIAIMSLIGHITSFSLPSICIRTI